MPYSEGRQRPRDEASELRDLIRSARTAAAGLQEQCLPESVRSNRQRAAALAYVKLHGWISSLAITRSVVPDDSAIEALALLSAAMETAR
jgi:hypothetical protein